VNPEHELRMRRIVQQEAPGISVTVSHEVLPQIREYTRTSATVINAYVQPIVRGYLDRMRDGLLAEGLDCELYLMTSSGGSITVETAAALPIQLVESGPAAGALIAGVLSSELGESTTLSFDMGGTTAKACVVKSGRPLVTKGFEVGRVRRFKRGSGLPVGVPVIDLLEIGAGGGSIAEIDEFGLLQVGPRSAGSTPGPACYGRGGVEPTVTDANLVLGLLNPEFFLGGEMALDSEAASEAVSERIAVPLGLDVVDAAAAINRVVTENMTEAARVHAVEMNVDLRRCMLIAFGGAGPIHAYGIAERLRLAGVLCPPEAGVLSALGLLAAPLAFEFARTFAADLEKLDADTVNRLLGELERQGRELLEQAGVANISFERTVDMCYSGQGYEVTTPIPRARFRSDELTLLKRAFDDTYETTYGRRLDGFGARCVTWRVLATGPSPELTLKTSSRDSRSDAAPVGRRGVVLPEIGPLECSVFRRSTLGAGTAFAGPALVEDRASTIVIPPGVHAQVDERLNVLLKREQFTNEGRASSRFAASPPP
jgi:N-methylhydantoinase A